LFLDDLGLLENHRAQEAFDLIREMRLVPNEYILTLLFKACSQIGSDQAFEFGKQMLDKVPERFQNETFLLTSALNMLVKSGDTSSGEK
jgi:hypothetical protein